MNNTKKLELLIEASKTYKIECEIFHRAYSIWLGKLSIANIFFVLLAGLLSLAAGASFLTEEKIVSRRSAGFLALTGAGLALIHNRLNCDEHQSECLKLKSYYKALSKEYNNLELITQVEEYEQKFEIVNREFIDLQKTVTAYPQEYCFQEAKDALLEEKNSGESTKEFIAKNFLKDNTCLKLNLLQYKSLKEIDIEGLKSIELLMVNQEKSNSSNIDRLQ